MTLVDNGLRWYVRGFDRSRQQFADFVINRIEQISLLEGFIIESEAKTADQQWHQTIELDLRPHPSLAHPETIEREYNMQNGRLTVPVRAAVAGYVLRRWNVDCSSDHRLRGPEYHLWLQNTQALAGIENLILAPGFSMSA